MIWVVARETLSLVSSHLILVFNPTATVQILQQSSVPLYALIIASCALFISAAGQITLPAAVSTGFGGPRPCQQVALQLRTLRPCCADGGTEYFYRSGAEGLLLQAFAPLLADSASLPPKLQRLLESAQNLGDPGVAQGKLTYPDNSGIAAPAHENVEKDRVHLMVSMSDFLSRSFSCLRDTSDILSETITALNQRRHCHNVCLSECSAALPSSCNACT